MARIPEENTSISQLKPGDIVVVSFGRGRMLDIVEGVIDGMVRVGRRDYHDGIFTDGVLRSIRPATAADVLEHQKNDARSAMAYRLRSADWEKFPMELLEKLYKYVEEQERLVASLREGKPLPYNMP